MKCEIPSAMQGFYFSVKFGLFIIYVLKTYRKKSSSILLRKNMLNSLLAFFSCDACTFSILEDVSVQNLETTPSTFLSNFFFLGSPYLELLIIGIVVLHYN